MKQTNLRKICLFLSCLILLASIFMPSVFASESTKYYLGEAVNTGEDNGYSGNKT